MRAWNKATSEPWAITESALQTILEIAERENEKPEAVAARLGKELQNTHTVTERDGVAVIPVTGPLFRYANLFTAISGATSYEILAQDFTAAIENPDINAIILNIDSPGGEVNGCSELANMIFAARGKKPIIAYASGDAASGAYWIASAADQVVASETSGLGSIGVVAVYRGAKPDKNAPTTIEIVSSQSPFKRLNPESDEGRAKLQTRIDAMAEVFVNTLARNRGIEATQVLEQFGGGDILIGAHAVNAGLADRIGSLEKLIAEFSASSNPALQRGFLLPATTQQKETAMNLETLAQEHPELLAQVQSDARASERSRIQTILASEEAKDRGDLAQHLSFATDMAADSAVAMLAKAPKIQPEPKTNGFDAAMRDLGNPKITPASAEAEEDSIDSVAKRLAAAS
ncbi:MAG: S49 family peptidase [Alphaproteobacteria bacterium]|jgi:signal peptide peptidase SppA|nr:S49 family peptidase [Alphaproteobacteria bacterium]